MRSLVTALFLTTLLSPITLLAQTDSIPPQIEKLEKLISEKKYGGASIALQKLTLLVKTEYAKAFAALSPKEVGDYKLQEGSDPSGIEEIDNLSSVKLSGLTDRKYVSAGSPDINMRFEDRDLPGSPSAIICEGQTMLSKSEITNVFQHDAWFRESKRHVPSTLTVCMERGSVTFSAKEIKKEQLLKFAEELGADFYRSFIKVLREQR